MESFPFFAVAVSFRPPSGNMIEREQFRLCSIFGEHKDFLVQVCLRMTIGERRRDVGRIALSPAARAEDLTPDTATMRAFLIGVARNLILKRWRVERAWVARR